MSELEDQILKLHREHPITRDEVSWAQKELQRLLDTQSKGHIGFYPHGASVPLYELFEYQGAVYRAPIHNVVDIDTGVRCGAHWQCSRSHFERNRHAPGMRRGHHHQRLRDRDPRRQPPRHLGRLHHPRRPGRTVPVQARHLRGHLRACRGDPLMPTAMRPGAQKMARKLAKLCIRGDMNDAIEATAVLAALFCKLAAREDNIPFDEVFVELMQHAAQLVDDGTVTLADFRKDR